MHTVYPVTTLNVTITYPSTDYPVPTYTTGTTTEQDNGWAFRTVKVMLHVPPKSRGKGKRAILCCHGGNQTAYGTLAPGIGRWDDYVRYMVDAGYVMAGADLGFSNAGNNTALYTMDLLYNYVTAITGGTKVGLMSSSGGGLTLLGYYLKRPERVVGGFGLNSHIDIDAARGTPGYVVPYSVKPGDPNADIVYSPLNNMAETNSAFKVTDESQWQTHAIDQGHTPARYPERFTDKRLTFAAAHRDEAIPYQIAEWFVGAINSPTANFRPVTYAQATHDPGSLLAGRTTDAQTLANGGLARSEIKDFFDAAFTAAGA